MTFSDRSNSRSRSRSPVHSNPKYSRSPNGSSSSKRSSRYDNYEEPRKGKAADRSYSRSPSPKKPIENGTRSTSRGLPKRDHESYKDKSISPKERSRKSKQYSRSPSKSPPKRDGRSRSYSRSPKRNKEVKRKGRSRSYTPRDSRDRSVSRERKQRSRSNEKMSRRPEPSRRERSRSRSRNWDRNDRESPKESNVLGVFGMSLYTDERKLEDEFYRFGRIDNISLIKDNQRRSRGFAFITFERLEDAKAARDAMKEKELDGRRIRIDYSITKVGHAPTPGQGYKGRPGRSPRGGGWNDSRRDGYGFPRRTSGDSGKGWGRSYGGDSRRPPSPYDRRQEGGYGYESRRRSRTRSPRR